MRPGYGNAWRRLARLGMAVHVRAGHGMGPFDTVAGLTVNELRSSDEAWHGWTWLVTARPGDARRGQAWQGGAHSSAMRGAARLVEALLVAARRGT